MSLKCVVIGQGYVGLPLAMRAVEQGWQVVGLEANSKKIELLNSGVSDIGDVTNTEIQNALESTRYIVSGDYQTAQGFDIAVITVPTPLKGSEPDLSFVISAATSISSLVTRGSMVILESTTYPGTTREVVLPILENGSGLKAGVDFHLGYSPERIDPGNQTWNLGNTPKIVSGLTEKCLKKASNFYQDITTEIYEAQSLEAAELAKILENTYRAVNIALVNEFALASSKLGIDYWDAINAASTKPFGFVPFYPGPGVGGHCLPIDPAYFSWKVKESLGEELRLVDTAARINASMPSHVVKRAQEILHQKNKEFSNSHILLIGLSYKKNTGDIRESPSIEAAALLNEEKSTLTAIEPFVPEEKWPEFISPVGEEKSPPDLIVVLTDHDTVDKSALVDTGIPILDTRHTLSGTNVHYL